MESTFETDSAGEYYVEVTNENGCQNFSNAINVALTSSKNIEPDEINVYPNPMSQNLIIDTEVQFIRADMFDIVGNKVIFDLQENVYVSKLANGIYLLAIQLKDEFVIKKIQKVD